MGQMLSPYIDKLICEGRGSQLRSSPVVAGKIGKPWRRLQDNLGCWLPVLKKRFVWSKTFLLEFFFKRGILIISFEIDNNHRRGFRPIQMPFSLNSVKNCFLQKIYHLAKQQMPFSAPRSLCYALCLTISSCSRRQGACQGAGCLCSQAQVLSDTPQIQRRLYRPLSSDASSRALLGPQMLFRSLELSSYLSHAALFPDVH